MKCIKTSDKIIFKFGIFRRIVIDLQERKIYGNFGEVRFENIMGAWKNFRRSFYKKKNSYYVQILTSEKIYTITPLLKKEKEASEILSVLKSVLKIEKIRV